MSTEQDEFNPFDRVLVRDREWQEWAAAHFIHCGEEGEEHGYIVAGGAGYRFCIPYEGNEDLVGTR